MALSSDLAGAFQIILAEQQAEERKETESQNIALALLGMEMRETENARSVLLKEYYDKKGQVAETEKMFDKYRSIDPTYQSQGGMDMARIVSEQNKIDMSAVIQNLDNLTTYQTDLESSLIELQSQGQQLRELQTTIDPNTGKPFWGEDRILLPHEYEQLRQHALTSIEEGGLGWDTTAGADYEFYKTDPSARFASAYQVTDKLTSEHKVGAEGSYQMLQKLLTPEEGKGTKDLIKNLSYESGGKVIKPSEFVVSELQRLAFGNLEYDDFLTNLNAMPADVGGKEIRDFLRSNPNLAYTFKNLQTDAMAIRTLSDELMGINRTDEENVYDKFVTNIADVTDPNVLFGAFDTAVKGLGQDEAEKYFDAIEAQLGVDDAWPNYLDYKDKTPPLDASLSGFGEYQKIADVLQEEFEIEETTKISFNEARQDLAGVLYGARYWGRPESGYDMPYNIEELDVEVEKRIRALTAEGKGDEVREIISAYDSYRKVQTELEGLYK